MNECKETAAAMINNEKQSVLLTVCLACFIVTERKALAFAILCISVAATLFHENTAYATKRYQVRKVKQLCEYRINQDYKKRLNSRIQIILFNTSL